MVGEGKMYGFENEAEKVFRAMLEFDSGLPQDVKEQIVSDDRDYTNYAAVMKKFDELYSALVGARDEDVKELKLEAIKALDFFEWKYDVDMRAVQKMIL